MTYTINENAKNVWIRDNENTQDLSLQTEAKLVYLKNGRTLEQELGEGSMVSNVATVDKQMSSVIDGTFDGAYESCVLEGRTLVNLIASQTPIRQTLVTNDYEIKYLKANTKYMAMFNITSNGTNNRAGILINDATWNSENILCQQGWNKIVITTTTETTIGFRIRHAGTETTQITSSNVVLIEYQDGLENIDIPFFEGMCDVKMPILRNVGKNLFDKAKTTPNKYIASTGAELDEIGTNRNSTDYIRVSPNSEITLFGIKNSGTTNSSTQFYIAQYGENKELIKCQAFTVISDSAKLTTDSATRYIRTTVKDDDLDRCQIEQGSTSTTYEDYKTNILHTSDEVVLRSLPSGVKDTYNALTGEYVQRIGETTVDGTLGAWGLSADLNGEISYVTISDIPNLLSARGANALMSKGAICNRLHIDNPYNPVAYHNCVGVYGKNIRIKLENIETTIEAYKLWLQANPIAIQYELATPITTTIKPSTIPFAYANGHVILESGYTGQSLLPTLNYSTVVNRTGQIVGIGKTLLKQETQLTNLEKLLIKGVIGLDYNNTLMTLNLEIDEVI